MKNFIEMNRSCEIVTNSHINITSYMPSSEDFVLPMTCDSMKIAQIMKVLLRVYGH